MYRLYGDEFRLYGARGALGALGASTPNYAARVLSPWFASEHWPGTLSALRAAELILGRPLTWKPKDQLMVFSPMGGTQLLKKEAKQESAYLEKIAAEPEGLGAVTAGVTLAVSAINAVSSFSAGRSAAQKARKKARGAKSASDLETILMGRYVRVLMELARLNVDPDRLDDNPLWREAFINRLDIGPTGKKNKDNVNAWRAVMLRLALSDAVKGLSALPTPVPGPTAPAEPSGILPPEVKPTPAPVPVPDVSAPTMVSVATEEDKAAVPETAAPAGGSGAAKLGLALLAARLLLGG